MKFTRSTSIALICCVLLVLGLGGCASGGTGPGSTASALCVYVNQAMSAVYATQNVLQSHNSEIGTGNYSGAVADLKRISTNFQDFPVPAGGEALRSDVINLIVAGGYFASTVTESSAAVYLTMIDTVTADIKSTGASHGCGR